MPDFDSQSHERKPNIPAPSLRSAQNAGFAQFLQHSSHIGRVPEAGGNFDWKAYEHSYCKGLLECMESTPKLVRQTDKLNQLIDKLEFVKGGDEHFIHSGNDLIVKLTYGNNFGMRLKVYPENMPDYDGPTVIPTGNSDHCYYLKRWMLLNEAFVPITSFLGLAPPDMESGERLPLLAIAQERLPGTNPSQQQIIASFRELGFIHISENAYYRPGDNILLGDAAPRNVRIVDGVIIPFDAVAENPTGEAMAYCMSKTSRLR